MITRAIQFEIMAKEQDQRIIRFDTMKLNDELKLNIKIDLLYSKLQMKMIAKINGTLNNLKKAY